MMSPETGTLPRSQFPALFHSLLMAPVQVMVAGVGTLFFSTATELPPVFASVMSDLPSPSISATTNACGRVPVSVEFVIADSTPMIPVSGPPPDAILVTGKLSFLVNEEEVIDPAVELLASTVTSATVPSGTTEISTFPFPSTSPNPILAFATPVATSTRLSKEAEVMTLRAALFRKMETF